MIYRSTRAGRDAVHQMTLEASLVSRSRDGVEQSIIAVIPAIVRSFEGLPVLLAAIVNTSMALLRQTGLRAARTPPTEIQIQFDTANPAAIEWAKRYAAQLIVEITGETEAAVRALIVRMFEEGIAPMPASRLIRDSVGLTQRYVEAVLNLRQRILNSPGSLQYAGRTPIRVPKSGMPAARLERVLAQYTERLQRSRARTIARTEAMRAANEGQRELWQEAIAEGILDRHMKRVWITFDPCQICSDYEGEVRGMNEPFHDDLDGPPVHPNCRCTLGLTN